MKSSRKAAALTIVNLTTEEDNCTIRGRKMKEKEWETTEIPWYLSLRRFTVRFSPRKRRRIVRSDDDDVDYNGTIKPYTKHMSDKKRAASGIRVGGGVDDDERGKARC